jgi:pimeloyl-ACP methyl ester carboxylesterase
MERTILTPDGRALAIQETGDLDGKPVLVHMGTPGSRHLYGPNQRDAAGRGLRLVSYDRPGYGGSSPNPGRRVADCVEDVRVICSALEIERLAMWGISGGGPHVLACAALLPDLVTAAASLASLAPYGAEGLDWFAGMGQANVDDFRLFFKDEAAARAKTDQDYAGAKDVTAAAVTKQLGTLLGPTDAAVVPGEMAEFLAYSTREGLASGSQGWWDDNRCLALPWGFELGAISVPVLLLHGRQDQFVPFGHGEWLARHIPGVEARLLDGDGHLTLRANRVPEVHAWLSEHL